MKRLVLCINSMASYIIDFVWVNEEFEMVIESITCDKVYDCVDAIPPYWHNNFMIKPNQLFKNPFKSQNDFIVICDVYSVNYLVHPPEIILAEHHQRKPFNDYMERFSETRFIIIQKYNDNKNLYRQHKQMCNYVGVDVFGRPGEYSIYTEKENVYNYVWISRYILYQLSLSDIEWGEELLLVQNEEDELTNKVTQMEINPLNQILDNMNI